MRTDLTPHTWVDFHEHWLTSEASARLHEQLVANVPFEQRSVTLFGRTVPQPRLIGWCGTTPYRYSGLTLPPRHVPECLTPVLTGVAEAAATDFNHLLLNLYRDGQDSMGMHADDEAALGRDPTVATLTLGATRKFLLRSRKASHRVEYALGGGSLLIMGGRCQTEYVHGIPKTQQAVGPRLSITFRRIDTARV
jgi:alkylated DNA repair dioxygenase AlkB